MAQIVGAFASSHTPQLSLGLDLWESHADRDRQNTLLMGTDYEFHTYAQLLERADPGLKKELVPEVWSAKYARAQEALSELKQLLAEAKPDVAVVIGDDQEELFKDDGTPMFATFLGAELTSEAHDADGVPLNGQHPPVRHAVQRDLGAEMVQALVHDDFDLTVFSRQPTGRPLGHAFTFPRDYLDLAPEVPIVPLFVNTYYPPNVPSARRCYGIGEAIGRAIRAWRQEARVVVIASGGLSHFIVDERLDREFLAALGEGDQDALCALPRHQLRSGTSEILNWIVAAGAARTLTPRVLDYVPGYRTPVGSGCGLGFAYWN